MLKIIHIKLTKVGSSAGPFSIYDQIGNLLIENVSKKDLINGISLTVNSSVTLVKVVSTGDCTSEKYGSVGTRITNFNTFFSTDTEESYTACLWKHLQNPEIYHTFYGKTEPYIIEYPFSYSPNTEILQSIKDYSRVYKYTQDLHGVSNEPSKVELDDSYFNEMIVYNNQQCSGLLKLVPKPKHNLKEYNAYPKYNTDSKTIIYTKSDNSYQINNFWDVVKDKSQFLFVRTCVPLSIDKELHQENMNYTFKSFSKSPLRAKDVRIRYILDNRSDVHIVSNLLFTGNQISYK